MLINLKLANRKLTGVGLLIFSIILLSQFQFCKESTAINLKEKTRGDNLEWRMPINLSSNQIKEYEQGEKLARMHCTHCHEYVAPDFLDRITWPRVFTAMEQQMDKEGYLISKDEWIKLQQFYLLYAANTFHSTAKKQLPTLQKQFTGRTICNPANTKNNATLLKYSETDNTLYLGEKDGQLYHITSNTLFEKYKLPNIPVDLNYVDSTLLVLGIGNLAPSELRTGQLLAISNEDNVEILVDSLKRPIHFQMTDFGKKEEDSYLIASFGSTLGEKPSGDLAYFNNQTKTIVGNLSGATQVEIADIDQDGQLEIIGLFSQGNESINIYNRDNKGQFILQNSLRFPPIYGTNSFQLADMNADGFLDLLVTHGDNDDYSQVFKPYHGIKIYLNDQQNNFTPHYFYQINGASKVKAADIDKDGDLDFVVLAMYPDLFSRPYETLLYFENIGELNFKVQYFESQPSANWMLLELADLDQDGDLDIITAANDEIGGLVPPALKQNWQERNTAVKVYDNVQNN